jgi:UDP-3-O-[3-hydroxymyristoyl] glucosamine N-acyltransferase
VKLKEIASLLNGEIFGDETVEIIGVSGIQDAQKGDITFISAKRYAKDAAACRASCIIVREPIDDLTVPQLKVANPYLAFARLLGHFYVASPQPSGISRDAFVSDKAEIAPGVSVGPLCFISDGVSIGSGTIISPFVFIGENSTIGEECRIHPHVTIREGIKIGNRGIIHSGTIIGSDGFGYVFDEGRYYKIPQVGGVIIGDDVEIGSNVSIDRATTGNTIIGGGTKIDNLTQIAHNVRIGNNAIIVAQVGIGGSTEIGDYVTLGGQAGVADHTVIDSGTMIGAQSGVMGHVSKGAYSGSPAIPHRDWLKAQAIFAKLPELQKRLRQIEEKLKEFERRQIL